ncbi:putative ankyrin repeat protein RF_0381 [Haliotis asinina]|uniref:putative ankyrin repeat protein RF_0381 n=1 Tax=Haliotis asinina TaxID=109174 RepID=UPI0035325AC9
MVGDLARVKSILSDDRTNINTRGKDNMTPVMHAAKGGHTEVFDLLVREGANLSFVDDDDGNILHLASIGGSVEIVQYVLAQNIVGINSRDTDSQTPVMKAAIYTGKAVFDLLLKAKADLSLINAYHETILHMACEGGNIEIIKYILNQDIVDIDSQDINGQTPAMIPASNGNMDVLEILVEAGADLSLEREDGETILHVACEWEHIEIIEYLLTHSHVDINSRDGDDCTPAMMAAREGNEDIFFLLVAHGADLTVRNDAGDNILNLACDGDNIHIVKYVSKQHIVARPYREDDPC